MLNSVRLGLQRHPRLVDAAAVTPLLLASLSFPTGLLGTSSAYVVVPLAIGLCAPALIRRRQPVVAFAAAALVALVQWLLGVLVMPADLVLLAGLYNVASRCRFEIAAAAAAVLEVGVVLAILRWSGSAEGGIAWSELAVGTILIASMWIWGDSVRTRRAHVEGLEERAARLERERDQQARIAAADERARIARELHDDVAHSLSVMVAQADGAAYTVYTDPARAQNAMHTVSATGREALSEMRRLVGVLRETNGEQDYAPPPGIAQLDELVAQTRRAGLPVELTVAGHPVELPSGPQLAAYRVVQEALTNTLKHAGPEVTGARVRLHYHPDSLELRVRDDGRGAAASHDGRGYGLMGMRERMAVYGGAVHAGPATGGGYEVVASLPLRTGEHVTARSAHGLPPRRST